MKKLYFVIMLCVAALFSANAQSAEKVSVKDLNYRFISKLPFTLEDAFTTADPILTDLWEDCAAKGYAFSLTAKTDITIRLTRDGYSSALSLLDANYEEIAFNKRSDSGNCVVARLDPGTYYIVAAVFNTVSSDFPYTLTVKQETNAKLMKELTYKPVANFTDTLVDSITVAEPYLLDGRMGARAKGYSVQLAAGDVFDAAVVKEDDEADMYMYLLDKDYNMVASNDDNFAPAGGDAHILYEATAAGTYNLVVTTYTIDEAATSVYSLFFSKAKLASYYIDPVDGDDAGTGITPSRPLKTLDAAIDKSNGVGVYYLMNDYQFGMTGYSNEVVFAKVYPYQKNIRLSNYEGYNNTFIKANYGLTVGDASSEYYFIVDSIDVNYYLFDSYYTTVELNNFRMANSEVEGVLTANNIKVANCEFKNNTVEDDMFYVNDEVANTGSYMKNTTVKDCQIKYCVLDVYGYNTTHVFDVDIENCQFTNNTFGSMPIWVAYGARLNLKSGAWQYNTRKEVPDSYSFSPKLNKASLAGICAEWNSVVTLYKDFTMDVNNFIVVDPTSVVNLAENLSGDKVATILPIDYDDSYKMILGYEEGRQVLTGSWSLLNANYQKFALAQMDDDIWYLRADGKIYLTPVGIKEDVLANTVIYPNPVTDQMTVRMANVDVTDLTIIDAFGRIVMTSKVSGNTEILNLSNLSSGMYFVQFRNHNTILGTQKIIKR